MEMDQLLKWIAKQNTQHQQQQQVFQQMANQQQLLTHNLVAQQQQQQQQQVDQVVTILQPSITVEPVSLNTAITTAWQAYQDGA